MAEKMYLTAYTYGPLPRPEFSRDGLQMNCNESALFLGNKMLPKDTVTLIELTVNSYTPLPNIRHLPIYVGFHEEPSLGILNASCCFGSLYYKEGADYDCFEHVTGGVTHTRFTPGKIYTRIPAATEVVGIKYDPKNNEISIYRDGNLFYKFSPQHNNLATGDFYPAVFVMNNCNLNARINFGKKGLQFPQPDAMSLFGFYFKKKPLTPEILFDLIAEPDPTRIMVDDEVLIDLDVDSDILPGVMVPLYMESPQAVFTDPTQLKFDINKPSTTNYDYFGATLTSNRGLPYDEKVYMEFQVKNGVLLNGTVGIPISVGISNTKGYIMNNSLRLNMFHLQQQTYQYKEVKTGVTTLLYTTSGIMTTVSPNQAMWVGVAFDLKNKEYTVYINSIPFYTVKVPSLVFTPGSGETYYFMLHQEGIEKNDDPMDGNGGLPLKGEVNFGQTPLHTVLPSGYMTLWDYYNKYYHVPILPYREICFDFMAYPYKMKLEAEILWHFRAIGQELFPQEASGNPGINQFKGTMNRVLDDESHFIPDQGIQLLDLLMRFDNFNYTTERLFEKEDFFRGQDIYIGNWENRVLRYIDFEYDGLNKRKVTKDIDFIAYGSNGISTNIDFDYTPKALIPIEIPITVEIEELEKHMYEITDGYVANGTATFTFTVYQYDTRKTFYDGTKNPNYLHNIDIAELPISYLDFGGSYHTIPESDMTYSNKIPKYFTEQVKTRTFTKSFNYTGIFDTIYIKNMIPSINDTNISKTALIYSVNGETNMTSAYNSVMNNTTIQGNDYIVTGTTTVNISGSSKTIDVRWTFNNVDTMPIRYVSRNNKTVVLYASSPGVTVNANSVDYIDTFTSGTSLDDIAPAAGVLGYSTVVDNTTTTTNITYSGNAQDDFDAVDLAVEFTNNKITKSPTEWYVENAIKISDKKWDVIKHYFGLGQISAIKVTYKINPDDVITIPITSSMISLNEFNYARPYSDAASVQPTTNETQINVYKYRYDTYPREIVLL